MTLLGLLILIVWGFFSLIIAMALADNDDEPSFGFAALVFVAGLCLTGAIV